MKQKPARHAKKSDLFAKKAERLRAEINKVSDSLYGLTDKDSRVRYYNLKTYRVEIFRGFVVHMHLATEDLLKAILLDFLVRQNRSLPKKTAVRIVNEIKSAEIIQWCNRLKLISANQFKSLLELNRVRNASAHNWILDSPKIKRTMVRGLKRTARVPTVIYKGKNLFNPRVFLDEFCSECGRIYLKLLFRVWKIQGKL
jgi:hypothetical protein